MKDLPQGTTQSHLDEIERQIDELYPELYEFVDDGGTQGYVPCGREVKFLLRTSLISFLEKYGEEVEQIYMDLYKEKSVKNYNEIGVEGVYGYNLALEKFITKLKEILSNLK